jgi:hypothetical protein
VKTARAIPPFLLVGVGLLTACDAILKIHDLNDPGIDGGESEAGMGMGTTDGSSPAVDATSDAASDASMQQLDAQSDALPPCDGGTYPCMVVIAQEAGAIYPTWRIASQLPINGVNQTVFQPPQTSFDASAADPGGVFDTTTLLQWQTALGADASAFDLDGASAFCTSAIGTTGWRVPTRIELSSVQYRTNATGGQTICVPPAFNTDGIGYTWTQTAEPFGAPPNRYIEIDTTCGYLPAADTAMHTVRCVKGTPSPATFIVSDDVVWAVDTNLDWERGGTVVHGYGEAKQHCDSLANGMRMPVIQELYSIIDTRYGSLFEPRLFVQPDGGGGARAILSQTIFSGDTTTPYYEAVSTAEGSQGEEDQAGTDASSDSIPDILVRCVRTHVN